MALHVKSCAAAPAASENARRRHLGCRWEGYDGKEDDTLEIEVSSLQQTPAGQQACSCGNSLLDQEACLVHEMA